jgi:hypothetical protein
MATSQFSIHWVALQFVERKWSTGIYGTGRKQRRYRLPKKEVNQRLRNLAELSRKLNAADDWVEGLLADLKCASATTWEGGYRAMPNAVERVIRWHLDRIDSHLCRSYCQRAISHFERLVEQSNPYAETLRQASARLRL